MAIPSTPPLLPMPIADSGDVRTIPEQTPIGSNQLSFQSGFPPITSNPLTAGGVPPQREDFNAAYKLLSQHAFFQQSGGVYPWQGANGDFAGLDYLAGWHVLGSNGIEYVALQASGPDTAAGPKDPTASTGFWNPFLPDLTPYAKKADFYWSNAISNALVYSLPNGTKIMMGSVANSGATTTAVFPVAFSTVVRGIVISGYQGTGGYQAYVVLNGYSLTGFVFNAFGAPSGTAPSSAPAATANAFYIAIGE